MLYFMLLCFLSPSLVPSYIPVLSWCSVEERKVKNSSVFGILSLVMAQIRLKLNCRDTHGLTWY